MGVGMVPTFDKTKKRTKKMSEEQKPAEAAKPAETPAEEKKDAEGQGVYKVYCDKCGWTGYYSNYLCYCPRGGCTGTLRRL